MTKKPEQKITHLLVPNDVVQTRQIKCAYCPLASAGAVQVEDPKKPGKQNFIRACNKHKSRAIQDATRQLRRYHKKRVVIDVGGLDDGGQ